MKRVLTILALACLMTIGAAAQDARHRVTSTIIADGLAQLPASNVSKYNEVMAELAATGNEGITMLAAMLAPAAEGQNAIIEYALNGVVDYVAAEENAALREGVRSGLINALAACTDNPNKAFLLTLLQMCPADENIPIFVQYLDDPYLADWAAKGIIYMPLRAEQLLTLMNADTIAHATLAYAAARVGTADAEPLLLQWLADADEATTAAIYEALAQCGTTASLKVLKDAAQAVNYGDDATKATDAYLVLLATLAQSDSKTLAGSEAEKLLKATDKTNVRSGALQVIIAVKGKQATPYIISAMKDNDREYRVAALRCAQGYADEELYAALGKLLTAKKDSPAKEDIINWLGTNNVASQINVIIPCISSADDALADAAIAATGKIGGSDALNALVAQLATPRAPQAAAALRAFNGDISAATVQALDGDEATQIHALTLAGQRHITAANEKVFALLNADSAPVKHAAYASLAGVVVESDFERLCALLATAEGDEIGAIQRAMEQTLITLPAEEKYALITPAMQQSSNSARYYPLLAQVGSKDAIEEIMKGYYGENKQAAFDALLHVENTDMIDVLYNIATTDKEYAPAALMRYNKLVADADYTAEQKYQLYNRALAITDDPRVENVLLPSLATTGTYDALTTAEPYIDKSATALSAAYAVRSIVSQNSDTFGGETVRQALIKAKDYLTTLDDADAGYAVDDINTLLAKLPETEYNPSSANINKLSEEEESDGYVLLFDGETMDGWTGNTIDYVPVDGTIYVSAEYGDTENLYTINEYCNFIFRFEFCYLKEGINNGVGIRTPMGVDAAYAGMEIQILDHDAPIYKGLREYQQHGSVYGIIPAKRVKFPPLGVWNTEEIRAEGNHITVIVNDEVILDGDIYEACQGHNVSEDGSDVNPYTVDHLNHPGLFNKCGHIGFLGHGVGLKLRNIRIKELPN